MKKTIGFILLALILAFLIGITCYTYGWKIGLTAWGISFALTLIIIIATFLIVDGG